MKKLLAVALSLAVLSPAYAQNDKPKDKKKNEHKHTLSIGFSLLEGLIIKLETKKDKKKVEQTEGALIGALVSKLSDSSKPKKMTKKKKYTVPATRETVTKQTAPSEYYLQDDINYGPPSTETPLPNTRRALNEHRLNQMAEPHRLRNLKHVIGPVFWPEVNKPVDTIKNRKATDSSFARRVVLDCAIPQSSLAPFQPLPQIIKPAIASSPAKTASASPTVTKNPIQRVGFVKPPAAGVIVIETKITEIDKNGKKNVLATPKVTTIPGQKASVQIRSANEDGIKLDIVANHSKLHPGHLMVSPVFHKMSKKGTTIFESRILTKSGVPATVKVGSKLHKNIELEIVAHHIFPNPLPPMTRVIKTGFAAIAKKPVTVCPHCQKPLKPETQKFKFFKKTKEGAFLIHTKTIESNETGNNFKIDISLDRKAANGIIEKVEFAETPKSGEIVIQSKITEIDKTSKKKVLAAPKMITKPGQKASMEIGNKKEGIKLEIVAQPLPNRPGQIMVKPVLFKKDKSGTMNLITSPHILTNSGIPAKVMMGTKNHSNVEIEVIADHVFPQPQAHKMMLRMKTPKFVFRGTPQQMSLPHLSGIPFLTAPPHLHAPTRFDKTCLTPPSDAMPPKQWREIPANTIYAAAHNAKKNQICESCKTAAIAKCTCCGKPMASKAMMPSIMQAGFAKVNSNEMTVKVYSIGKLFAHDTDNSNRHGPLIAKMMKRMVQVLSWDSNGGKCSLEYFDASHSLVVRQTEKGHQEVADFIGKLADSFGKK